MGMTIDEAMGVSETCQYILSNQVGSNWCKSKYDAVTIAIDTMRKYQKIEQIIHNTDYIEEDVIRYKMICEVIEDGKID